jgi:hypothetical protein
VGSGGSKWEPQKEKEGVGALATAGPSFSQKSGIWSWKPLAKYRDTSQSAIPCGVCARGKVADYSDCFADEHWSRTRSAVAHTNRIWHSKPVSFTRPRAKETHASHILPPPRSTSSAGRCSPSPPSLSLSPCASNRRGIGVCLPPMLSIARCSLNEPPRGTSLFYFILFIYSPPPRLQHRPAGGKVSVPSPLETF